VLGAFALALRASAHAAASPGVVVGEGSAPALRDAAAAALEVLHDALLVDAGDPAAVTAALQRPDVAVVLAVGARALKAAQAAASQLPTVSCLVPTAEARPSRTLTGVPLEVPAYAEFAQFKLVDEKATRIGVIFDPRVSGAYVDEAEAAAQALDLTLVRRPVDGPRGVRAALAAIAPSIDALWLVPDSRLFSPEMMTVLLDATIVERKIALYGFEDEHTRAGALASVSVDVRDAGRRAARLAASVAGRPPQKRLPVPEAKPSPGALTVNKKTARRLGVEIPELVLKERARHVYE
jgi:ABC-type uncharacterized transport system substrate-binding protein